MKNKSLKPGLTYFFGQHIHGKVLAWVKPASASEIGKRVIEDILRWEDDGGPVYETGNPLLRVAEINTPHP